MLNYTFIAEKHDPAYYKRLIDLGSKRQLQRIWSALQIQARSRHGGLCGSSQFVPRPNPHAGLCMSWGRAGPNFHALAPSAVRFGVENLRPALPRSEHTASHPLVAQSVSYTYQNLHLVSKCIGSLVVYSFANLTQGPGFNSDQLEVLL